LLSSLERQRVAETVGIGAIKYADLAHNRTSDYVFSYDKMVATTGNTATYMQYSYARVQSIFAKGGTSPEEVRNRGGTFVFPNPAERALALEILRFEEALLRVTSDYRPNHLTNYLFELASRFSTFFDACHVNNEPDEIVRTSRQMLCDLTARTLQIGLSCLGIEVAERI
jgi:arginyl-tRNA synthetase